MSPSQAFKISSGNKILLPAIILLLVLTTSACKTPGSDPTPTGAILGRLEPKSGIYWGVNLDWGSDSIASFTSRLNLAPAVAVYFISFPWSSAEGASLEAFFQQAAEAKAIAMLTLEPFGGLETVTFPEASKLAEYLVQKNSLGIKVIVRFGHEVNGSWYAWCQQPERYKEAFQIIAEALHAKAPQTAMMWAPNYGGGYPFAGGRYEAKSGSSDFKILDTNGDGRVDMTDDPYSPYYPGDEYVDWVGMSLYHWGNEYPWGENEVPEDKAFISFLTGTYNGLDGNHSSIPDFYQLFCEKHDKPLAITETAALFNPSSSGASQLEIKQAWWRQIFSPEVRSSFPHLKMVNWFEWRKYETEISGIIDWTVSLDPIIRQAFIADFPRLNFILGG